MLNNFGNFHFIWLKLGVGSFKGKTQYMHLIFKDLSFATWPNWPNKAKIPQKEQKLAINCKMLNCFGIYYPIGLKLVIKSNKGKIKYMQLINEKPKSNRPKSNRN